jgi:hypothetical protein
MEGSNKEIPTEAAVVPIESISGFFVAFVECYESVFDSGRFQQLK